MSLAPSLTKAERGMRRNALAGLAIVLLLVVGVGGWAAVQSIDDAVVAPGTIVVGSHKKTIQHQDGGIVAAINVAEGDRVAAGAVLFRLDDKLLRAELGTVQRRIFELAAKRWRLIGERDDVATLPPWRAPEGLPPQAATGELADIVAGQQRLFESKRELLIKQEQQMRERIKQLGLQADGLQSVMTSQNKQLAVTQREMQAVGGLRDKGLIAISRWTPLERQEASLIGDVGQAQSQIAAARGQISETELKLLEAKQTYRKEALDELQTVEGELSQLVEKRAALDEKCSRLEIRAPVAGRIHELAMHTVGGVVSPANPLAFIVPDGDPLVIEVLVPPREIDRVRTDMPARVRFTSFDHRSTPELNGHVTRIAADRSMREDAPPVFKVRVAIDQGEVKRLGGVELLPGMEAETMMTGHSRTVLSYLTKPLVDQVTRAFRER